MGENADDTARVETAGLHLRGEISVWPLDDHLIGALAVLTVGLVHAGDTVGLGRWWKKQPIVRQNRWLI